MFIGTCIYLRSQVSVYRTIGPLVFPNGHIVYGQTDAYKKGIFPLFHGSNTLVAKYEFLLTN